MNAASVIAEAGEPGSRRRLLRDRAGFKGLSAFSAAPAFNVRPVQNGIEVVIRYITRANERHQVRSRLYQEVVSLLGRSSVMQTMSSEPAPQAAT